MIAEPQREVTQPPDTGSPAPQVTILLKERLRLLEAGSCGDVIEEPESYIAQLSDAVGPSQNIANPLVQQLRLLVKSSRSVQIGASQGRACGYLTRIPRMNRDFERHDPMIAVVDRTPML